MIFRFIWNSHLFRGIPQLILLLRNGVEWRRHTGKQIQLYVSNQILGVWLTSVLVISRTDVNIKGKDIHGIRSRYSQLKEFVVKEPRSSQLQCLIAVGKSHNDLRNTQNLWKHSVVHLAESMRFQSCFSCKVIEIMVVTKPHNDTLLRCLSCVLNTSLHDP